MMHAQDEMGGYGRLETVITVDLSFEVCYYFLICLLYSYFISKSSKSSQMFILIVAQGDAFP